MLSEICSQIPYVRFQGKITYRLPESLKGGNHGDYSGDLSPKDREENKVACCDLEDIEVESGIDYSDGSEFPTRGVLTLDTLLDKLDKLDIIKNQKKSTSVYLMEKIVYL